MTTSQQHLQLLASFLSEPAQPQRLTFLETQRGKPLSPELDLLLASVKAKPSATSTYLNNSASLLTLPTKSVQTPCFTPTLLPERQKFILFVKILFRYLDRLNNPTLKVRAKLVIAECTQRNRMGLPEYTPLMTVVERRLKQTLGDIHVVRAKVAFHSYLRKSTARSLSVTNIQAV